VLSSHRWRYADCHASQHGSVWDAASGIGLCGDWLHGGKVEGAWLSGRHLAASVLGACSRERGVVWFKRDLRLHDHAALTAASLAGPVLCLYIIEPALWQQPDASSQHYHFALECLQDLAASLAARGLQLLIQVGEAVEVLARLHAAMPFDALYAHEETGNGFTYQRDLAVGRWCLQQRVQWQEFAQTGVIRRLRSRDGWAARWTQFVSQPCLPVPDLQAAPCPLPGITAAHCRQPGHFCV
jgi:deoxyribodipyrimidine photo-lyase